MRRSAGPITSACSVVGVMPSSIAVAIAPSAISASPRSSARGERLERALDERRPGPRAAHSRASGPVWPSTSMKASSSTGSKCRPRCSRIICDRVLDREGLAVDAVAGERVEHVGDRDDPALDRDRLALQPARVAAAVPLLLVAERDRGRHVEDRGGGAAHEPVALLGVGLDDRALLRRQRARASAGSRRGSPPCRRRAAARRGAGARRSRRPCRCVRRAAPRSGRCARCARRCPRRGTRPPSTGAAPSRPGRSRARRGLRFSSLRAAVDLVLERRPAVLAEVPSKCARRSREHENAPCHDRRGPCHDRPAGGREGEQPPQQKSERRVPATGVTARGRPAERRTAVRLVAHTGEPTHRRPQVRAVLGGVAKIAHLGGGTAR